jgi:hypothetical protein
MAEVASTQVCDFQLIGCSDEISERWHGSRSGRRERNVETTIPIRSIQSVETIAIQEEETDSALMSSEETRLLGAKR